jgi:hypothetical protein
MGRELRNSEEEVEMNQLGLQYTCAWKQCKESLSIAIFISKKQKRYNFLIISFAFSLTKLEKRMEQVWP